jgi:hypothetical protein
MKSRINVLVQAIERCYPDCWEHVATMRKNRGKTLSDWPDYCYLPLAGAYAIVSNGESLTDANKAVDIGRVGALAAWKAKPLTKEFPPETYSEIMKTQPAAVSSEIFRKLPKWCTYIKLSGSANGVFVHLEHDVNNGREELRLLFDTTGDIEGLFPLPIHLGGSLKSGLLAAVDEAQKYVDLWNVTGIRPVQNQMAWLTDLPGIVSLALKLCEES